MENQLLILIETMDEASYFVNRLYRIDPQYSNCHILAFIPNVSAYLKKQGLSHVSMPVDFIDVKSWNMLMEKCEELENCIQDFLKKSKVGFPQKYFIDAYHFYLRQIWRHFIWDIETLAGLLRSDKYKKVFAFEYCLQDIASPWIEEEQLYVGNLLKQLCGQKGIEFVELQGPVMPKRYFPVPKQPNKFVSLFDRLSVFLFRAAYAILSGQPTLFVPSFKYNMNLVCNEFLTKHKNITISTFYIGANGLLEVLRACGILLYVLFKVKIKKKEFEHYPINFAFPIMIFARSFRRSYSNILVKRYLDQTMVALRQGQQNIAIHNGLDFLDCLERKVRNDLFPYMLQLHFQAFGLEKALETLRPDFVLSQMNFELYGALGEKAKKLGIPAVLISHGSHVLHREKSAYREHEILARNILVGDYQYLGVQSPLAEQIARKLADKNNHILRIKPILWGRKIKRTAKPNKDHLTLVHAGTFKLRHNRRFIYETADEFMKSLQDLTESIAAYPHLKLIIRLRPDICELSLETIKALLPLSENVSFETSGSFQETLQKADLLVSLSSTTIEDALSNNVPVLLYGAEGRYSHIPCEPFSENNRDIDKAVSFVKNKDDLRSYFNLLNEKRSIFSVPEEKFKQHCFAENETVDFINTLLNLSRLK